MPEATRECPACALDVDAEAKDCPYCGYEFPRQKSSVKAMALLFVLLLLLLILFW